MRLRYKGIEVVWTDRESGIDETAQFYFEGEPGTTATEVELERVQGLAAEFVKALRDAGHEVKKYTDPIQKDKTNAFRYF